MKKGLLCMAAALVCAGMLFAGGGQDSKAAANKSGSKELTVAIWDKNQEPGLTKILTSGQAKQAPNRSAKTSPPIGTFLLRQSFMTLPKDLEQAALLDGCNIGQTFLLIMLPLVKSGMVALGIFTALFAFKELMRPLVVNTDQNTLPLSAALAKLQGQFAANYPELMAASFLACLPMIVLYIIFQKQFVAGIATSGSKL